MGLGRSKAKKGPEFTVSVRVKVAVVPTELITNLRLAAKMKLVGEKLGAKVAKGLEKELERVVNERLALAKLDYVTELAARQAESPTLGDVTLQCVIPALTVGAITVEV